MIEVKEKIDLLREERNLSAKELADQVGISETGYYDHQCATAVREAWQALDRAVTHTNGSSGAFFAWKFLEDAGDRIRLIALALADLYAAKSQAVQRAAMIQLAKRAGEVLSELRNYGA